MNRSELIKQVKAILDSAYAEGATMVMLYLDDHPKESQRALCQEIDPDNWNALRQRVQRAIRDRKASQDGQSGGLTSQLRWEKQQERTTKQVLREATPERVSEIVKSLPVQSQVALKRELDKVTRSTPTAIPAPVGPTTRPTGRPEAPPADTGAPVTDERLETFRRMIEEQKEEKIRTYRTDDALTALTKGRYSVNLTVRRAQHEPFSKVDTESLLTAIEALRSSLSMLELALSGWSTDIDWDSELANLEVN